MIVAAVAATRTRPASIGVKDNAKGRGAVQLTVPDMDHCIGSRRSPANFRFARKDMPISVSNANKAITAWIMLIPPKGEITSDWYVRNGVASCLSASLLKMSKAVIPYKSSSQAACRTSSVDHREVICGHLVADGAFKSERSSHLVHVS